LSVEIEQNPLKRNLGAVSIAQQLGDYMARIFSITAGPDDRKSLLTDPDKHWRAGFSTRALAHSWETADGFPPEVAKAFSASNHPAFASLAPLLAVPDFKVPLPGGSRPSQSDIFVLARSVAGPVVIMIEGKVEESFGPTLHEWLVDASPGKDRRLGFLLRTLGLLDEPPHSKTRYQLLQRAASALIVAEQYHAAAAVMLVHSFSPTNAGWVDYESFLHQFGVKAVSGAVQRLPTATGVPLFAVWARGDSRFLNS